MAEIIKKSVYTDNSNKAMTIHLEGGAGDEYITESMWVRCDDMDDETVAAYDALPDTDVKKLSLQYKLAKIKASADDKVFVTDAQIDGLFGACDTTTEPDPEPAPIGYTLVLTTEANTENASVYSTLVGAIFTGDTTTGTATISIDGNEAASYSVKLTADGININDTYLLKSTGMCVSIA